MSTLKANLLCLVLFTVALHVSAEDDDCKLFMTYYNKATKLVTFRQSFEKDLLFEGIYNFKRKNPKSWEEDPVSPSVSRFNDVLATAAKLMADEDQDLTKFESYAKCLGRVEKEVKTRPKYRPMNGYGNNLKHPYYGTPNSPFGRFAPKNYDDGINAIRKSVYGSELPAPRQIVQEVLIKAERKRRMIPKPNLSLVSIVLYVSHDLANKISVDSLEDDKEIRCCTRGRKEVLSPALSNAACSALSIGEKDPFYSKGGVRCLNVIRSETSSYPSKIQFGEILNRATAYMDHSVIYGNTDEENRKVRTGRDGKLNLGTKNLMPVDNEGRYIASSNRFWQVIANSAIWPVVFSRLHNILAGGLKTVNPHWNDETLFQETRRINIAWLQQTVFESDVLNVAFNKSIKESYSENRDPATTLEFNTAAYRFLHFFSPSTLMMTDKRYNSVEYPISDVLGNFSFAEQNFDDLARGLFNQGLNFDSYTDELYNKLAKDRNGFGFDLLSLDILRGREQGLPTFVETRRLCNLSDVNSFEDMKTFMNPKNVELLKNVYDSVYDIDLYVGGALESFEVLDTILIGQTFQCVIVANYRNTMGADAYYAKSSVNPYKFTDKQADAIKQFQVPNAICATTGFETIRKAWSAVKFPGNDEVPCTSYAPFDLTAWKDPKSKSKIF